MNYRSLGVPPIVLLLAVSLASLGGFARAAPEEKSEGKPEATHSHERCELHGGVVDMTQQHHFETVFVADGIRIYMYTAQQDPMMIGKAIAGTATLKLKDGKTKEIRLTVDTPKKGEKAVYFCPMHTDVVQMVPGVCPKCGGMTLFTQNRLYAKADLSKVDPGSLKAVIHITGLKGPEAEVTFTETNAPPEPETAAPASKE